MRGAIIPSTQEDTSSEHHLWFSPGWLTTMTTHLSGMESHCLEKPPQSYHTPVIFVM